jgi:hypothetical protein
VNSKSLRGAACGAVGAAVVIASAVGLNLFNTAPSAGRARAAHLGPDGAPTWHRVILAASCGTPDESSRDRVEFAGSRASIAEAAGNGSVTLRYAFDLILFDDDSIPLDHATLVLSYRDNGGNARIVARLKGYDTNTATTTTLMTFDSNDYPPSNDFQHRSTNNDAPSFDWDSGTAYFIEVMITKSGASGDPELGAVELWFYPL